MRCPRCKSAGDLVEEDRGSGYLLCLSCGHEVETRPHDLITEFIHEEISGPHIAISSAGIDEMRSYLDKKQRLREAAEKQDLINRRGYYPVYPRREDRE